MKALENLKLAEEAAAEVAALFPGFIVKPAMQMLPEGSYCYIETADILRFCALHRNALRGRHLATAS